jgi:hypothetical protein|tara:strand:+ start:6523 stop:7500 length:978 start_codon:yes stop_codon:yes gene_type:complete
MSKKLIIEGLNRVHLLNEVVRDKCGTHYTSQYLFEEGEDFDPFGHVDTDGGAVITDPVDEEKDCVLGFSNGNAKLEWPYFSLPAGYTCPFATVCKNFAAKPGTKFSDGKSIKKGKEAEFLCYAARQQAQYKGAANKAFKNLDLMMDAKKAGGAEGMATLILKSLKFHGLENSKVFRIHEAGDFFDVEYFKAWMMVASKLPSTRFYAYTTSIQFWIGAKGSVPKNMKLIASMDKNNAKFIVDNGLRYALVVYSPEQAKELGLRIDVDDTLAWSTDENFALIIHGGQHAGSDAAKALKDNKASGLYDKMKVLHKKNRNVRQKKISDL